MKRMTLLLAALGLMLAAFPAMAADSNDAAPAVEKAPVENAAPAPEVETGDESLEILPGALDGIQVEPRPASCDFIQCRQSCNASCSPGCVCVGACVEDYCDCNEFCY